MHVSQPRGLTSDMRSCFHPQEAIAFFSLYAVSLKRLHSFTTGSKPDFRVIKTILSLSCGNTSSGGFPDWQTHWRQSWYWWCWETVLLQQNVLTYHLRLLGWYATVSEETNCMAHAFAACLGVFFLPFLLLWHQLLDIISNVIEKASFYEGLV